MKNLAKQKERKVLGSGEASIRNTLTELSGSWIAERQRNIYVVGEGVMGTET